MSERLFCEVYVDASELEDAFANVVNSLVGGKRSGSEVFTNWTTIDIVKNDEFGERFDESGDEFLAYRYKLEFELEEKRQLSRSEYIDKVGELLMKLWGRGYKAVAACGFENELPSGGGYPKLL